MAALAWLFQVFLVPLPVICVVWTLSLLWRETSRAERVALAACWTMIVALSLVIWESSAIRAVFANARQSPPPVWIHVAAITAPMTFFGLRWGAQMMRRKTSIAEWMAYTTYWSVIFGIAAWIMR